MSPTQLVCLDMAGTTVADDGTVTAAFEAALDDLGVEPAERQEMRTYVAETMGTSKIEVFRALFGDEMRAQAANRAFEAAYARGIALARPIPGALEAINALKARGMRVALTTGFSVATRDALLDALGWRDVVDLALSPSDAGRGRPYPDMILTALLRLGIDAVQDVAVVGDTAADIHTGLRAGARPVIGVLTGADDGERLAAAGATLVVDSVATVPDAVR